LKKAAGPAGDAANAAIEGAEKFEKKAAAALPNVNYKREYKHAVKASSQARVTMVRDVSAP